MRHNWLALAAILAGAIALAQNAAPPAYDLLIRGARVIDGTGNPWRHADVAVAKGRIAAVGNLRGASARRVIEAPGRYLVPGFIDMHSHSDLTLLVDGNAESKIRSGVTTEVLGESTSGGPASKLKQQFLGYGEADMKRGLSSTEQRATLLGWGQISHGDGHQFELPLPPSLAARTELRRLTATLAWLTPTDHKHRDYRRAQLWIDVPGDGIGTPTCGLDAPSARRGTVEHRVFQGTDDVPFLDGDRLRILVGCREDAGKLDTPVPYAIAITLEVGADVEIDVYQEISARIRPLVEVEATS